MLFRDIPSRNARFYLKFKDATMTRTILIGLVILGAVALQIYLSTGRYIWTGFVLPLACVVFSVFSLFNSTLDTHQSLAEQIAAAEQNIETAQDDLQPPTDNNPTPFDLATTLIIYNIPTVALLIVFFVFRKLNADKHKRKSPTLGSR